MRNQISSPGAVAFLTALILATVSLAAQADTTQRAKADHPKIPAPVLKASELARLNKLLRSWYLYDIKALTMLNRAEAFGKTPSKRDMAKIARFKKNALKRRKAFYAEFKKQSERVGSLLSHFGDLLSITHDCLAVPKGQHARNTRLESVFPKRKDAIEKQRFARRLPESYVANKVWPLIFCLPDRNDGTWIDAVGYLDSSYPRSKDNRKDPYLHACPDIPSGMDLAELVDPADLETAPEDRRIKYVIGILGHLMETYRIDTDRVYLEAEGASTAFAVRIASLFPDRFAGLILINPTRGVDKNLVAENIANVPVLILHDEEHSSAARLLNGKLAACLLEAVKSGSSRLSYAMTIKAWTAKIRRNFYAQRVVINQASNRFKKAYWVQIQESPHLSDVEEAPRIEARYDRASNKISIKSLNVTKVRLLLNDLMLDLDKEVLFDLNGRIYKKRLTRNKELLWHMSEGLVVRRGDPLILFVSSISLDLPDRHKLFGLSWRQ